ncbi:MAG: hypothetical protein Q9159_005684 [Coniocarpon cinnabarinum]
MTNEQRMDEGRRMFQIFAARMFEQRVLGAYREDVSKKKAEQLIAEEEAEKHGDAAREAKKAREAEKKKQKKQAKKQEKAEKEQKKEAERLEAEREAHEAEARRQEELRAKREEQKKKREAEKKAQDEERRRKEEEKRRQQEELRAKQQEKERQARETKAAEKRRKEEERKKQLEEKEAKANAARERKAQQEQEQREQEDKAKAEAEAAERRRKDEEAQRLVPAQADQPKRAPAPAVALPPSLKHRKSGTGSQPSPQIKVATPALPKAPTPQQRQPSAAASQTSSAHDLEPSLSLKQSTPPNQPASAQPHPPSAGSTRAPSRQHQQPFPGHMTSPHTIGPPPGMSFPPQTSFPGMPAQNVNGFPPGMGGPSMHHAFGTGRGGFQVGPQLNMPIRPGPQQPSHFGYNVAPNIPGHGARTGPLFGHDGPSPTSSYNGSKNFGTPATRSAAPGAPSIGGHSRQASSSFESSSPADSAPAQQPIGRPAPIKRPESTRPERQNRTQSVPQPNNEADADAYLGSSALLGDSEPSQDAIERRQTAPHLSAVSTSGLTTPGLTTPGLTTPGFGPFNSHAQPFARSDAGYTSPLTTTASGWSSGWGGPSGLSSAASQRHGAPRHVALRRLAVDALSNTPQDDVEISKLLSYINNNRPRTEPLAQMNELQVILETEVDSQNGGQNFEIKSAGNTLRVGLQRDLRAVGGVRGGAIGAEIGSPLPNSGRAF